MPEKLRAAIEAWKAADAQVKQAEQELSSVMDAYLEGKGPPVQSALVARVAMLRAVAVSRLKDSVEAMRVASSGNP